MKVKDSPPIHLTYCLNIHPGETWDENFAAIRDYAVAVKTKVSPDKPFGLGMRLGAQAAAELSKGNKLKQFKKFLADSGMYVFTINGFPYGRFHGRAVKREAYQPDWRDGRRLEYTLKLAQILSELLPYGVTGSISTVPIGYKTSFKSDDDMAQASDALEAAAMNLAYINRSTGRRIVLALEPEPDCVIESADDAIAFFDAFGDGDEFQRHIGVCYDTAHAAVEFEDIAAGMERLIKHGIALAKVQVTAGLALVPGPELLAHLEKFADEIYLHQVRCRGDGGVITRFADLGPAIEAMREGLKWRQCRVHFHVPLFFEGSGGLNSTSDQLTGRAAKLLAGGICEHLEIETYTFGVLPENLRSAGPVDLITREYQWVQDNILGLRS